MTETVDVVQKLNRHNGSSPIQKFVFQVKLLLWKRYCESTKSKLDLLKVIVPALLFFVLLILIYEVFTFFSPDGIEAFFVPFAFWIFIQRIVVQIMYEKSSRLQESMRMMGLSDSAYWTSYFISDGVILGFVLSFLCAMMTLGGLFNDANFGVILGLLYCFCLSAVPFAFFLCSFFDTPQTSGQATLGILFGKASHEYLQQQKLRRIFSGFYVLYVVVFVAGSLTIPLHDAEVICCLFPPLALQIGSGAFLNSYSGIGVSNICGIMVRLFACYRTE
jgi:hypothetical protein